MAESGKARMLGYNEAAALLRDGKEMCGCGRGHKMLPFSDRIAGYGGRLWVYECLLDHLVSERDKHRKTILGMHRRISGLLDAIASSPCIMCGKEVGRGAKLRPAGPTCVSCENDLGGGG